MQKKGRPGIPIRLMVGLHYLKHAFNESDETVVARRPKGFTLPSTEKLGQQVAELIAKCKPQFADPAITKLTWSGDKKPAKQKK